jgi:hypothetical protein
MGKETDSVLFLLNVMFDPFPRKTDAYLKVMKILC